MAEAKDQIETPTTCCNISGWSGLAPQFFKALGDANRVAILGRLAQSCTPQSVGEVAGCCTVDMSVVSRHLATLRQAGILAAEKRGRTVYYSVRYQELVRTLRSLADAIEACCGPGATATCPTSATAETKKESK